MKRMAALIFLIFIPLNASSNEIGQSEILRERLVDFQNVIEETFVLRQSATRFFESMRDVEVLSGDDLVILGQGMDSQLQLKDSLLLYQRYYQKWGANARRIRTIPLLTRIKGVLISLNASLALYDNYALAMYLYEKNPRLNAILNTGDQSFDRKRSELFKSGVMFHSVINREKIRRSIQFVVNHENFIHENHHDEELSYLYMLFQMSVVIGLRPQCV